MLPHTELTGQRRSAVIHTARPKGLGEEHTAEVGDRDLNGPVVGQAEACAEKLARYRRVALGRDVYDLAQFAARPIDEWLVRRLWVLKV